MPEKINVTSYKVFENSNITGDYVDVLSIAKTDEDAHTSREFGYNHFGRSVGLFGLLVECSGNASDALTITAQFNYSTSTWTTKTIALSSGHAGNASALYRLDINSSWRTVIPFSKMRFTFQKSGTNAACTVTSRLVIY
jgi:hypothetical protein